MTIRKLISTNNFTARLFGALTLAALAVVACDGDDEGDAATGGSGSDAAWECTDPAQDGWQQCDGTTIAMCHSDAEGDGHFHSGADCSAWGSEFSCVIVDEDEHFAGCLDGDSSCEAGEVKCEENTAYNCVDGKWALSPCGTAQTCELEGDHAHCHGEEGHDDHDHGTGHDDHDHGTGGDDHDHATGGDDHDHGTGGDDHDHGGGGADHDHGGGGAGH